MTEKFPWTPELVSQAISMYYLGKSCAAIGRDLGCSKNAVIGKIFRARIKAGIPVQSPRKRVLGPKTERARQSPSLPNAALVRPLPARATPRTEIVFMAANPVGLVDLEGCKWAVGFDADIPGRHLFCNAEQEEGKPYCQHHMLMNVAHYSRTLIRQTVRQTTHTLKRHGEWAA